jgi:hypothetical protein
MKIVSAFLVSCLLVSTTIADDHSVADTVNFDLRAIGQTQGAGVPNAVGLGAFVPLHKTSNAVTYVDIEVKGNVADRSGDSSIINTEVAGTTPESIDVILTDVEPSDWAQGGMLFAEKT